MASVPKFLTPVREVGRRPDLQQDDRASVNYVRSFLALRLGIGALGVLLPPFLVLVDRYAFEGHPFFRNSMSAYYYSGMRDALVGVIFATGAFLIAYKFFEVNLDNAASIGAGVCAVFIAFYPTSRPSVADHPNPPRPSLTPLQELLSETTVKYVHFGASIGFIGLLAALTVTFGYREGKRRPRMRQKLRPEVWKWFHYGCAIVIGLAALALLVISLTQTGPRWSVLAGETICAWAFGVSWFAKGAEFDMLFGKPNPERVRPD